jgi:hypothetical protein
MFTANDGVETVEAILSWRNRSWNFHVEPPGETEWHSGRDYYTIPLRAKH